MSNDLWCTVCNKAVSVGVSRGVSAAVVPLAGMAGAALPRLFRKKSGVGGLLLQGAVSAGAAYLASRYLVPLIQGAVCGQCGTKAGPRQAASAAAAPAAAPV